MTAREDVVTVLYLELRYFKIVWSGAGDVVCIKKYELAIALKKSKELLQYLLFLDGTKVL
jgi:hypothetical protein